MHRSRGRNSSFCFLSILGDSKWPDRAEEVDLYPVGSIWKGFEPPVESQNFAKFWNAWGVCLFVCTQGSLGFTKDP